MKRLKRHIALFIFIIAAVHSSAQGERKIVRAGNNQYKEKKYSDAEVSYKKALLKNKESKYAEFNLGNAYYKQEKYEDAVKQFTGIASNKNLNKAEKASAYHNLGNTFLQQKKYEESIAAYKNALKLNPKDEDTRYNLAYAQAKLQKEKQQQQQQQKNKDQKQDQDKDQKKDSQQKPGDDKKEKGKQAQPKPQKISKEDAEKILKALNNDEKDLQKKKIKAESGRMNIEKNW
ncbi:MAG: tetratricopeptide repeat protein [Bacteroidota bacterium]|nr:tetratricopeptide repeat protein [Bacteroidota bacterium]